MRCSQCGFENNDKAKFCTKCGKSLVNDNVPQVPVKSDNSKYIIIALAIIAIILVGALGYFIYNMNANPVHSDNNNNSQNTSATLVQSSDSDSSEKAQEVSSSKPASTSTKVVESKSWESIGKYSGSGSGSKTISVPDGKIMVKLSAYPIKNYATNHLKVSGSNGEEGSVEWGPESDVETRSDSFEYTSSNSETFTIDYYETESWEVEFFRYQ